MSKHIKYNNKIVKSDDYLEHVDFVINDLDRRVGLLEEKIISQKKKLRTLKN